MGAAAPQPLEHVPVRGRFDGVVELLAPWLAVFASPYFAGLPAYYEHVLLGRGFSTLVVEWQPATPSFLTAFFYVLGFGVVALLARSWSRTTRLERIVLVAT